MRSGCILRTDPDPSSNSITYKRKQKLSQMLLQIPIPQLSVHEQWPVGIQVTKDRFVPQIYDAGQIPVIWKDI